MKNRVNVTQSQGKFAPDCELQSSRIDGLTGEA